MQHVTTKAAGVKTDAPSHVSIKLPLNLSHCEVLELLAGSCEVREVYSKLSILLLSVDEETASMDARDLIAEVLKPTSLPNISTLNFLLDSGQIKDLSSLAMRRMKHEPLALILGHIPFRDVDIQLKRGILIPRPETELLVGQVVAYLREVSLASPQIIDLGTGSGCILASVLSEFSGAYGVGTDIDPIAIRAAQENISALQLSRRAKILKSFWLEQVNEMFDVIVSNPPYIPSGDIAELDVSVLNYEPVGALDGGTNGLEAYHHILKGAHKALRHDGALFLECGIDQAQDIKRMCLDAGFSQIKLFKDYHGIDRIVRVEY